MWGFILLKISANNPSDSELNWFYSIAPDYVINDISRVILWDDLLRLLKYDSEGWFYWLKDSSCAMINVIKGLSNQKNGGRYLFEKFNNNPLEIKTIYDYLVSGRK